MKILCFSPKVKEVSVKALSVMCCVMWSGADIMGEVSCI